ncbi:MAG: hypothetical protein K9M98_07620 [Cephaloticoccus sp.]|nr:hypothetical protein [Cephaloticoccus sp.]MCF7760359.1 hypothetical protein [Cephaloticoccus sp.]
MPFLPRDFQVPAVVETAHFRMRSITIHDAFKDFDAVMSNRQHLWDRFGEIWGWPPEDMTIEQNIVDLGWHQKEFQLRSSFDFAVMSLDEKRLLGCVYVDPPCETGTDADIWFWARQDKVDGVLEPDLRKFLIPWLSQNWPFSSVTLNGEVRHLKDVEAS